MKPKVRHSYRDFSFETDDRGRMVGATQVSTGEWFPKKEMQAVIKAREEMLKGFEEATAH